MIESPDRCAPTGSVPFTGRSYRDATLAPFPPEGGPSPVSRFARIALVLAAFAALAPAGASAAPHMLIGFQDDPTFRWMPGVENELDMAQEANVSLIRATADWRAIAAKKPVRATNPFDKNYNMNDLDALVRNAQTRGIQVMITIWGTPKWANGGKGPSVPPRKLSDLTNFARAIADRYSGRHAGYPYVGRYSIWNEPNLEIFLTPQFDKKGQVISPRTYAGLYKAGRAGIKAANKGALMAMGETSNWGRDHPSKGSANESTAPGTFARLLAQQKGLQFDAYATHPYPTRPNLPPTQKVRWPNVTMTQLDRFGTSLDAWFHRRNVPLWITEYGYETKPGEPAGVTNAQQSSYLKRVVRQLQANPRVQLFVWFIFRDSKLSLWQSGLLNQSGRKKPAYNTFASLARTVDGETLQIKQRVPPTIRLAVPRFASVNEAGSSIGVTYRIYQGPKFLAVGQAAGPLRADGTISFVARFTPVAGKTYTIDMDANDISGNHALHTFTLITQGGKTVKKTP